MLFSFDSLVVTLKLHPVAASRSDACAFGQKRKAGKMDLWDHMTQLIFANSAALQGHKMCKIFNNRASWSSNSNFKSNPRTVKQHSWLGFFLFSLEDQILVFIARETHKHFQLNLNVFKLFCSLVIVHHIFYFFLNRLRLHGAEWGGFQERSLKSPPVRQDTPGTLLMRVNTPPTHHSSLHTNSFSFRQPFFFVISDITCAQKVVNSARQLYVPVKMGQSFSQQVMPPSEVNWPRETSRKKTGRPPPNRKMK